MALSSRVVAPVTTSPLTSKVAMTRSTYHSITNRPRVSGVGGTGAVSSGPRSAITSPDALLGGRLGRSLQPVAESIDRAEIIAVGWRQAQFGFQAADMGVQSAGRNIGGSAPDFLHEIAACKRPMHVAEQQ